MPRKQLPWLKWRRPLELNHLRAGDRPNDARSPPAPKAQRPHKKKKKKKTRLKRKRLNHLVKNSRKNMHTSLQLMHTCVKTEPKQLATRNLHAEIRTTIPGITSKENQSEAVLRALALEEIDKHYPVATWTHIYTDGSAKNAS